MSAMTLAGISLVRGEKGVLHSVDLAVEQGTLVALIGPNGAGKTSLLRLLAGLEQQETGTFALGGKQRNALSSREMARLIAFMPQEDGYDVPFTVQQNALLGRAPWQGLFGQASREDTERVAIALRQTGLTALADKPLSALSGGERQRAVLARVLCQNPEIFLLDEPTSAQDYGQQVQVMRLLKALCKEGKTVVLATHDVNLAAQYADHVLLLRQGSVLASGSPHGVLTGANLEHLYDCTMLVDVCPFTGAPRVLPEP